MLPHPTAIGKTPVANGSKVPPCPILLKLKILEILEIAWREVIPLCLSSIIQPLILLEFFLSYNKNIYFFILSSISLIFFAYSNVSSILNISFGVCLRLRLLDIIFFKRPVALFKLFKTSSFFFPPKRHYINFSIF